ncbi:hypothetical protein [Halorientalis pallida]|uniref:Uncharacterized protein n=1 Tax=Halorientalis pallida TaxID=2479928 RepID=A0A498L2Z4_9EURY|nr:hypothetical protein [Halorientalis pallida]RXK50556.1 hypothetical protein EAF64_08395 [Halorientalis pallida]
MRHSIRTVVLSIATVAALLAVASGPVAAADDVDCVDGCLDDGSEKPELNVPRGGVALDGPVVTVDKSDDVIEIRVSEAFLKAKKAFKSGDGSEIGVMPGDNVSDVAAKQIVFVTNPDTMDESPELGPDN